MDASFSPDELVEASSRVENKRGYLIAEIGGTLPNICILSGRPVLDFKPIPYDLHCPKISATLLTAGMVSVTDHVRLHIYVDPGELDSRRRWRKGSMVALLLAPLLFLGLIMTLGNSPWTWIVPLILLIGGLIARALKGQTLASLVGYKIKDDRVWFRPVPRKIRKAMAAASQRAGFTSP